MQKFKETPNRRQVVGLGSAVDVALYNESIHFVGIALCGIPHLLAIAECHRGHSLQLSRNGTEAVPCSMALQSQSL
jgi:hypothetical protein